MATSVLVAGTSVIICLTYVLDVVASGTADNTDASADTWYDL